MVIVCVSPLYKESANCRMEAKYAASLFKKGKLNLIFLMMDKNYTTHSENSIDGWLAFMLGDALWYPLWDDINTTSTAGEIMSVLGSKGKIQHEGQSPSPTKFPSLISPSSTSSENVKVLKKKNKPSIMLNRHLHHCHQLHHQIKVIETLFFYKKIMMKTLN